MHKQVHRCLGAAAGSLALAAICAATAGAEAMKGPKTPLDLAIERQTSAEATHSKVYGGQDAPPGAFPYQVSLILSEARKGEEFNYHICGGSLIADTWVLTAGHCVTQQGEIVDPKGINVYIGSVNFKNGDRIAVKSVYRHPQYNADFTDNDVALLKLERAPKGVKFGKIALIDGTKDASLETPGTDLTIVGWGTTEQGSLSKNLRYTSVKMVDRAECNANILQNRAANLDDSLSVIFRNFRIDTDEKMNDVRAAILKDAGQIVNENMICAGEPNPKAGAEFVHDTCQGDSGGPLVAKSGDKPVQVGIVSWGEGCGIPKLHGVYTRLGKFVDWVKSTATD